jgi:hypothetical protein
MAHTPTDDELLVSLNDVHHPILGVKKLVTMIQEEKPDWNVNTKRVRTALGLLRGDEAAATAAVAAANQSLGKPGGAAQASRTPADTGAADLAEAKQEQEKSKADRVAAAQKAKVDAAAQKAKADAAAQTAKADAAAQKAKADAAARKAKADTTAGQAKENAAAAQKARAEKQDAQKQAHKVSRVPSLRLPRSARV